MLHVTEHNNFDVTNDIRQKVTETVFHFKCLTTFFNVFLYTFCGNIQLRHTKLGLAV